MLKGDWSLAKNRTHIKSKICWIQICASSQIVKICCNREKSEGDFWETVPNPFFLKLLKVSLLMRNSAEHVSVASSSPTSIKCHCFCYLVHFLVSFSLLTSISSSSGRTYTSRAQQRQYSWVLIPVVLLNWELQLFLKAAFWFAVLKEYHAAKKTFWLSQLSILSNSWLYTQPTCTHSWLPIQFSCHKESSALKFSFLLELSHSQVEDGLLHLLSEAEGQQRYFNSVTN